MSVVNDGSQRSKVRERDRFEPAEDAVYGRAARMYWRAGWSCPLPLPARKKEHPPTGYTGGKGYGENGRPRLVTVPDIKRWEREHEHGNVALRLIGGQLGIDVDAYDGKVGGEVLSAMEDALGELPPTYVSTSRDDGVSGIRFFKLPAGVKVTKEAEARVIERFGRNIEIDGKVKRVSHIEIIREDHRYAVVWPSVHPDTGAEYGWTFDEAPLFDEVPTASDVPELPEAWVRFLFGAKERPVKKATAGRAQTPEDAVELSPLRKARQVERPEGVRELDDADEADDEAWADDEDDLETPDSGEREFDDVTAQGIIRRQLKELSEAPRSRINDTLNQVAFYLFHFTPAFIDEKRLARQLIKAQETAWINSGGDDDQDYTAAKKTIKGARDAARRSWTAVLADADSEVPDPLEAIAEDADGDGGSEAAQEEKTSDKHKGIFFTDARFSELVADVLRQAGVIFVREMGWMRWNGVIWERTGDRDNDTAMDVTRRWVLKRTKIAKEKVDAIDPHDDIPASEVKRLEALLEAWRTMCARSRRSSVVADAKPQVTVAAELFDKDPDVINTPSGVVDLRTGEVRDHDRELYMTKVTRAPFRGTDHEHPLWTKAVGAIPDDVIDWVQVFMGQGITGRLNTEGRLLLLDGDGNNGKGALTNEGVVWTLGDYAVVLSESLLLANSGQHPTEKMALRGARMTLIDETPEARRLDTQRLKKLLDQPVLAGARYLYKEEMRVELTHTMIVSTNYVPAVTEYDWGTWRRLLRLRMPITFKSASQLPPESVRTPFERLADPELKSALKEDEDVQAACLAWLVRGAMKWYAAGRCQPLGDEPERIKADTKLWRADGDLIMNYLDEFLESDRGSCVVASEVFEHFTEWAERNGYKPWSIKTFRGRFLGHDAIKDLGVQDMKLRRTTERHVSHPPDRWTGGKGNEVPVQFAAFTGVKFRDEGSTGAELDESVFEDDAEGSTE